MTALSDDAGIGSIYGEFAGENIPAPVSAFTHVNRTVVSAQPLVPAKRFRLFATKTPPHRTTGQR